MKIISWNVNGLRAISQKGFYEFWQAQNPDILCIQETKCHPDQLEEESLTLQGWHGYWCSASRAGYSGTATFTKTVPIDVQCGFGIRKFDTEGRVVITRFKDFVLYNCYFPNGGSGMERHEFKQEFLRRFGQHVIRLMRSGEKVIVVGDYNVAYMDIDVYDPVALSKESGFLPEERRWMENFLESGFVDSYRYFYPDEKERYTWWAYYENARVTNKGWRIDHICVSKNLAPNLRSARIFDEQTGSDHSPVMIELDL